MAITILRLPAVKARTGLSRSTIYLRVADGSFPRPVSLGARAVGWVESEVEDWISLAISASRGRGALSQTKGTH
jgi:prophage regulatory protein